MKSRITFIGLMFLGTVVLAQKKSTTPPAPDLSRQRVEQEVSRLSLISGGVLGVAAIHVETGKRFSQHGGVRFPMASTYKIPIAIQLLSRVDSGMYTLDQLVEVTRSDMHPGSGMIAERFNWPGALKPGLALSVRSLLELMLLISDNSATDICLRLAGGPSQVNACMRRLGITGLSVDRPTAYLISDWLGIAMDPRQPWSSQRFDSLEKVLKPEMMALSSRAFDADVKDTSTPEAMSDLLLKLYGQPILKPETKALLLDIMARCETGLTRLKGALPPNTVVMHKTGTIGMTANDVGIITLPGDAGHLVISIFTKSSEKPLPERERAIAEVARVLHDYFLLNR
ncbi:MAG: class A beta-lactamase [Cyclobacteriaceae bacterium]|nr:class A beta-lactamase [Cyclobacteriaceae bacterium]